MDFYTYFSADFIIGLLTPFIGIYGYYKHKKNKKEALVKLNEKNYYKKQANLQIKLLNHVDPFFVVKYSIVYAVILYIVCTEYNFSIITKTQTENTYLNNNIL